MSDRSFIIAQIAKKNTEIQSLEEKIKVAKIYVKALEDVLRAMEGRSLNRSEDSELTLRKGSLVDRARDLVVENGRAMHIDDILMGLGRDVSRESKASLASSLAAYVRKGEIFTRPAPNTFGLVELDEVPESPRDVPPEGFGGITTSESDDEIPF